MAAEHPIRRSGRRLVRDVARALGLGALIAVASAAAPAAAGAAGIVIQVGGAQRHLSPDEITASVDQPAGTYLLRAEGTTAEPVAHPPALSVRRLVQLAGGSPDALSFVSIERPNGRLATLTRADLTDPPPFAEGPPIVWIDAGGTRYLRPLRSPADANAADNIGVTSGDLVVRIRQGPLLTVRAEADRSAVRAGETVAFSAQVGGAAPGAALSYAWSFGDGTGKPGAAARHAFRTPGVYEVVVSVSGADDSGGSSIPLRIRVGDPPKGGGAAGGGAGDRRRAPAQGPATHLGDGAGSADRDAPRRGGGSAGSGAGGAPVRKVRGAPRTKARANDTPSMTHSGATPAAAGRRRSGSAPRTPRGARPAVPAGRRAADRGAVPRPEPAGRLVRGTLVAARLPAPSPDAETAQARRAREQAAARRGADARKDPLAPVAGAMALAGLLALGVRRERGDLRRRKEATR